MLKGKSFLEILIDQQYLTGSFLGIKIKPQLAVSKKLPFRGLRSSSSQRGEEWSFHVYKSFPFNACWQVRNFMISCFVFSFRSVFFFFSFFIFFCVFSFKLYVLKESIYLHLLIIFVVSLCFFSAFYNCYYQFKFILFRLLLSLFSLIHVFFCLYLLIQCINNNNNNLMFGLRSYPLVLLLCQQMM